MRSGIRHTLGQAALPAMRFYLRFFPLPALKPWIWRRVHWRSYRYECRTRSGARMAGDARDIVQGSIYYFGIWEPSLTDFIARRMGGLSGRVFVDVGANVGYYTVLAAMIAPKSRVVSIEAFPSIYGKLAENVRINGFGNVRTIPTAIADVEKDIVMFHGGPSNEGNTTSMYSHGSTPLTVKAAPLSAVLTDDEVAAVRLIKIDVEGAEGAVIDGMRSMLSRLPDDAEIVVEMEPGEKATKIYALLVGLGYNTYALGTDYVPTNHFSCAPTAPARTYAEPTATTDVIFSKVDAARL